jgi:hypothetical protein
VKTIVCVLGLVGTLIAGMVVSKVNETAGGAVFLVGLALTIMATINAGKS